MRIAIAPATNYSYVYLRQLERSDVQRWYEYLSKDEVVRFTTWSIQTPDDLEQQFYDIDSTSENSNRRLAIVLGVNGPLIGTIGFHSINEIHRCAEIAFDLAPAYWGKGILSSVCKAVTQWSFHEFGFNRVQGHVIEGNIGSAKVLHKCGFHCEGKLRQARMVKGVFKDVFIFSRLRTD